MCQARLIFRAEWRNRASSQFQACRIMRFPKRVILSLTLLATAAVCTAASKSSEPTSRSVHQLDSSIEKQCGVTFSVPRGVIVFLVKKPLTTPSERCTLALLRTDRPHVPATRGVTEGYYEEADLVLVVKAAPSTDRLVEFNFAPADEPGHPIRYVGQPLTEAAKRMGYMPEKVIGFSVTSKNDASLLAAEAMVTQRGSDGSLERSRRLDVLWGKNDTSVGATVWCIASKPRDCEFQKQIRTLFGTLSTLSSQ